VRCRATSGEAEREAGRQSLRLGSSPNRWRCFVVVRSLPSSFSITYIGEGAPARQLPAASQGTAAVVQRGRGSTGGRPHI
jgi:hypothetical protein